MSFSCFLDTFLCFSSLILSFFLTFFLSFPIDTSTVLHKQPVHVVWLADMTDSHLLVQRIRNSTSNRLLIIVHPLQREKDAPALYLIRILAAPQSIPEGMVRFSRAFSRAFSDCVSAYWAVG